MSNSQMLADLTERQQLTGGVIAFVLATVCIFALPVIQTEGTIGGVIVGLLVVTFFVIGTLSIGTSERVQV